MWITWYIAQPLQIQIYLAIGLFLLSVSLLFIVIIQISQLIKRTGRFFRARYINGIQNELSLIVVQSTFSETSEAAFRFKLEKLIRLSNSQNLALLILDEIVSMKKNLVGESAGSLKKVYLELGLREVSIRKLKSRNWKTIAKGMRELEVMEQEDALPHLVVFLNSSNYYLRRESRLSIAGLAPTPLFFLDSLREYLSEWERILLFQKLGRRSSEVLPDFSQWYSHPNFSVVTFCVEMTIQFGQMQNIRKLELLLQNTSRKKLICQIIEALRRMEAVSSLNLVCSTLHASHSSSVIISCLRFIGSMGDESYVSEINRYVNHKNPLVRMESLKALTVLGIVVNSPSREIQSMLDHITHPLLT